MSTPEQRMAMARAIINFEARRDKKGRLQVYKLPAGDGGGRYEVAGINEKYNKEVCDHLVALIEAGQYDNAEALATEFVASDTDVVVTWSRSAAIESYLRDSTFNRGHTGGAKILQMAVGVTPDGVVGPTTRAVVALAEQNPGQLLLDLRAARERYERIKRNEKSPFWKGLVNRWNTALKVAKTFLPAGVAGRGLAAPEISATSFSIETAFSPISDVQTSTAVLSLPLPALRLGMRGPMVKAWEMFLSGEGFDPGEADGVFDDKTDLATRAFQSKFNIEVDGIAGRQSLRKAMDRGFELIEEPAADNTGSNFPPKPGFPPLVTNAQRQAVFGAYDFVAAPLPRDTEHIRILGTWERDNIINVPIPQLKKTAMARAPATMQFHELGAAQLQGLWKDWERAGLLDRILTYGGAFNPRFVRGSTKTLSNHAFGSAFDVNERWNERGHRPALVGQKGSVRELAALAHKWGFWWGGHFGTPDGMHFEVALVK